MKETSRARRCRIFTHVSAISDSPVLELHSNMSGPHVAVSVSHSTVARGILKVFSVVFSTLLRSGFVLVRQSIVLCSQEQFER